MRSGKQSGVQRSWRRFFVRRMPIPQRESVGRSDVWTKLAPLITALVGAGTLLLGFWNYQLADTNYKVSKDLADISGKNFALSVQLAQIQRIPIISWGEAQLPLEINSGDFLELKVPVTLVDASPVQCSVKWWTKISKQYLTSWTDRDLALPNRVSPNANPSALPPSLARDKPYTMTLNSDPVTMNPGDFCNETETNLYLQVKIEMSNVDAFKNSNVANVCYASKLNATSTVSSPPGGGCTRLFMERVVQPVACQQ